MSAHITTISEPTMTSLQIAEVLESRHDKVKQSIDRLVNKGVIAHPPKADVEEQATTPSGGRRTYTKSVYHVGKRDSYVVVAQLSPEFTARLVDRWQELEQQQATPALPDFNDPAVAARAWADQVEQVQQTRKELTEVRDELGATREKVETYSDALNRIAKSGETFPITEAAKLLKMKPGKLFAWMANNRWIYRGRSDGPWKAYQDKIDGGLMWVSIFQPDKGDGAFKVHQQARVTGKGLIYLAQLHEVEIIWKWRDECRGSQG